MIDLKTYLDERDKKKEFAQLPGPVITISREHGCAAMSLANKIISRLSKMPKVKSRKWTCINKEVLDLAAKELEVSTSKIKQSMDPRQKLLVKEMLSSFTQFYDVTDKNVLDTLKDVIQSYANKGNTIIVGRGGALVGEHIGRSLHIKLQASFEWRITQIMNKYNLSLDEATTQCLEMDEKRNIWNLQLSKTGVSDVNYDVIFNRETLSETDILEMIFTILHTKKITG